MKYFSYLLLISILLISCKKWDEYRQLVPNGEVRYPGIDSVMNVASGKNRFQLTWHPTPDVSVQYYVVYWNNMSDSLKIVSKSTRPADTLMAMISGLQEGAYSVTVYAYDQAGNRSMPRIIPNVYAYGNTYIGNLYNRSLSRETPWEYVDASTLRLHFTQPDTININTEIRYTDLQDQLQSAYILPGDEAVVLPNFKPDSWIARRSSYIPTKSAIDTFYVSKYDSAFIAK
jgi:hypothetical protein